MILKGGYSTEDPRLDRVPQFDARSWSFPIRELLEQEKRRPRSYTWPCSTWLDQGREGACVGFAWAHELAAAPTRIETGEAEARVIYREAQQIDPWPGENYEGTSVLAGAQVVQRYGHMAEYRWAFGLQDVVDTVGAYGPCVLGVAWYDGMFRVGEDGFIRVAGRVAGGHAILCRGVNLRGEYVTLRNSWGRSWGKGGDCRLSFADLDRLLREDGEACVPTRRVRSTA